VVAQDGSGTLITADPPTGTDAARLVQAMATFGPLAESPATVTGSLLVSSWRPLFSEPAAHAPGLTRAL